MTYTINTDHARKGAELMLRALKEPVNDRKAYAELIASMAIYVCRLADVVDGTPERMSHEELLK